MCGIAGYVAARPSLPGRRVIERMTDAIRHRGPDESGIYEDERACLGHRRLSIIDVAAGRQPMSNEDGSLWIVYNGEVFNHADLRPELEKAGHRYRTRCDTETILHAYEEYGLQCVERFQGMFAFAIWDKQARRLFCARDRLGKKPFYYYWDGRTFAFASEIKALLKHPTIPARFEEPLLGEYLAFGYASEERTLFAGIRKLMPGHSLTLEVGREHPALEIRRYWDIPPGEEAGSRSNAEWIHECRERLEESVRLRLMSDVPLGVFLSGGVDSSAIAALIRRITPGPVKTFAVGYREDAYSELGYARRVAGAIGTEHHDVSIGMEDFFEALPRLVWHEDEPLAWPSSVSLYFVSKLASKQVKVVLTGEGSDELFGGYGRYRFYQWNARWLKRYRVVPRGLRWRIRSMVATSPLLGAGLRRKLQHTFVGLGEDLESLYLDNFYSAFSAAEQAVLFPGPHGERPYRNFLRYWAQRPGSAALARMLFADQKTYLVELLMKQDQMSMAASIESRVPFLDHRLVEFSARVPERLKLRMGEGKYIVKRAVEDLLPGDIVYRKKMGFPTPLRDWLLDTRANRLFEMLQMRGGLLAEYVDGTELRSLIERHRERRIDATDRIWRLLNLEIWGDLFLNGRGQRWDGLLAAAHAGA
jgi:asparagine synthase (glutamine-hydrolysing)